MKVNKLKLFYTNLFKNSPIRSNNSPPAAYSRKMYSMDPCVRLPKNLRMFGWARIFCIQTSFLTDDSASGCFSRSTIFIATASPERRLMSNFTLEGCRRKILTSKRSSQIEIDSKSEDIYSLSICTFAQSLGEIPVFHKLPVSILRCHFDRVSLW